MKIEITLGRKFIYFFTTAVVLILVGLYAQPLNIKSVLAQAVTPMLQNGSKFNDSALPNVLGVTTSVPYQNVNGNVTISGKTITLQRLGTNGFDPDVYTPPGWAGGIVSGDIVALSAVRTHILCLGGGQWTNGLGDCRAAWPAASNPVPGYLTRFITPLSPNQCDQNFTYTLSATEKFPNQIDAVQPLNGATGTNPTNPNTTVGTNNSTTQQIHAWSGVGACNYGAGYFFVVVFGH